MNSAKFIIALVIAAIPYKSICQGITPSAAFDFHYTKALSAFSSNSDSAFYWLSHLEQSTQALTSLQQAKLNFAILKIRFTGEDKVTIPDSLITPTRQFKGATDSLISFAHSYLERSMPDRAIPLLLHAINFLPEHSAESDNAKIELCEAYRQKQEYAKGADILYDLLHYPHTLSDKNKAYAYNRLAAIYNEWSIPPLSYKDSVIHYATLCADLATKINSAPDLATALNELSLQYLLKKEYSNALELSEKAVKGFIASSMPFCAMNALILQSNIYLGQKDYPAALQVMTQATQLAPIWENRNLYRRIYKQYANIYAITGNFKDAFEFLTLSSQLQVDFFKDRINSQINEQSAHYDLLVKEQKIREEKEKNAFKQRQILLLTIIIITLFVAFLISFYYFRLKRQETLNQKLLGAIVETETNERRRIARDLHDGLGPVLSAINHYFQAFLDAKPESRDMIQTRLRSVISEAIDEVSRISHNISPHVLENHGLVTALNNLVAPLNASGKYQVDFSTGLNERLTPKIELTAYRCIAELLNNTLKHADATKISLHLNRKNDSLLISYADNGKGFNMQTVSSGSMGLYNINNRIESFGGSLTIKSSPHNGMMADITLPL